ncbi:MAG: TIGR02221 family CRISPR-associated protein [Treponemataceae bacterium]
MSKKFISFLGTGKYTECQYSLNGEVSDEVKFVQEALLKLTCKDFSDGDSIHFILTEGAREKHWENTENNGDKIVGLKTIVENFCDSLPSKPKVNEVGIPDGKSEKELWEIFEKINEIFDEGDEVIFDITHGFRSLPMLCFAVLNYAVNLKNIKIKAIYYGAFEAKNDKNIAPIFNLKQFAELMQWSSAVDAFINYGYADKLDDLVRNSSHRGARSVSVKLKDAMNVLNTVRGGEITQGKIFKSCVNDIEKVKHIEGLSAHPAFEPLFERIKEKLSVFDYNNPYNFMYAAKLNLEYGREQQAVTLLQEGIITVILYQLGESYDDRETREKAGRQIQAKGRNKDFDEDPIPSMEDNKFFQKVAKLYVDLSELRNNINHAGYTKDATKATTIIENTQKYYNKLKDILLMNNEDYKKLKSIL